MLSRGATLDGLHECLSQHWYGPVRALSEHGSAVLAVSGGPDSLAMLAGLGLMRHAGLCATRFVIGCVDHGLRPESAQEASYVQRVGALFGLPVAVMRLEPPAGAGNRQAWAREERYRALCSLAGEVGGPVLTAHTLDDQAETFLMRAARGAGADGLSGIRDRVILHGQAVLRPFLRWPRSRLHEVLDDVGLEPVRDPSNDDSSYTRVRFRGWLADAPLPDSARAVANGIAESARIAARESEALHHYACDLARTLEGRASGYAEGVLDPAIPVAVLARALRLCLVDVARAPDAPLRLDLARMVSLAEALVSEPVGHWVGAGASLSWRHWGAAPGVRRVRLLVHAEPGRSAMPVLTLRPGETALWDGRFRASNDGDAAVTVRAADGSLGRMLRSRAGNAGPGARLLASLPVIVRDEAVIAAPAALEATLNLSRDPTAGLVFVPFDDRVGAAGRCP